MSIGTRIAHLPDILPGWYNVKENGLAGNGSTDDTAALQSLINFVITAGGGTLYFPAGTYLIGGALTDTGLSNCQVKIPYVALNASQVTINFVGASRPPMQYDPGNGCVPPVAGYSIIKSTLTGAAGGAMLNAKSSGTFNQTNVQCNFKNLVFANPANPTFTCLDLTNTQAGEISGVLIHAGTVSINLITQPTTSTSFGLKVPPVNQSPCQRNTDISVFGFYVGMQSGELSVSTGIRFWGCIHAIEMPFAYHPQMILDIGVYGCPYGMYFTGTAAAPDGVGKNYFRVLMWDNEHETAAAWQTNVADVYDPNNVGYGDITWLSIAGGVGVDHIFIKNGGTNITATEIGASAVVAGNGWWNNNGAISGAVAAYAPKGASSYTASLINLVNSGTHPITNSGTPPTWATGTGWTFNGTTQYLGTDIQPPNNQNSTLIVKYNSASGAGGWVLGVNTASGFLYGIQPIDDGSTGSAKAVYLNGSYVRVAPSLAAGVLALRGAQGNRNGTDESAAITNAGTTTSTLFVGAENGSGATGGFWAGVITSWCYYNSTLTAAQIAAIIAAGMP